MAIVKESNRLYAWQPLLRCSFGQFCFYSEMAGAVKVFNNYMSLFHENALNAKYKYVTSLCKKKTNLLRVI